MITGSINSTIINIVVTITMDKRCINWRARVPLSWIILISLLCQEQYIQIPLIDSISIVCFLMMACCASSFSSLLADSDSNFLLVAKKKTKLHYLQTYNSTIIVPIDSTIINIVVITTIDKRCINWRARAPYHV